MADAVVRTRIDATKAAAAANSAFTDDELNRAVSSLQGLLSASMADGGPGVRIPGDWAAYRELLAKWAHESHKQWERTDAASQELAAILGDPEGSAFRTLFDRVLRDGNWGGAEAAAAARPADFRPWVILVTGVNGARKTSSVYQPWFKDALRRALAAQHPELTEAELPDGDDSFFRQLDYMMATLGNEEFRNLYTVTDLPLYAALKDSIFGRYRMLAEMLGILLCKESQKRKLNIFVETSGRDIAMFKYVDQFFPESSGYRKLVVHFTINDLTFAERSVDSRMEKEMADGAAALQQPSVAATIEANAGGPYGSAALAGVEAASEKVWESVLGGALGASGEAWHKACLAITGRDDGEWTVAAVPSYPAGWLVAYSKLDLGAIKSLAAAAGGGSFPIAPRKALGGPDTIPPAATGQERELFASTAEEEMFVGGLTQASLAGTVWEEQPPPDSAVTRGYVLARYEFKTDGSALWTAGPGDKAEGTWCIGAEGSLKVELTSVQYEDGPGEPHTRDIALALLPELYKKVPTARAENDDDIDID